MLPVLETCRLVPMEFLTVYKTLLLRLSNFALFVLQNQFLDHLFWAFICLEKDRLVQRDFKSVHLIFLFLLVFLDGFFEYVVSKRGCIAVTFGGDEINSWSQDTSFVNYLSSPHILCIAQNTYFLSFSLQLYEKKLIVKAFSSHFVSSPGKKFNRVWDFPIPISQKWTMDLNVCICPINTFWDQELKYKCVYIRQFS